MKIAVYIYPDDLRLFDEITHLYHMRRSVLIREAMRQFVEREYEIAIKLKTSWRDGLPTIQNTHVKNKSILTW